jgi:hypothetical protein
VGGGGGGGGGRGRVDAYVVLKIGTVRQLVLCFACWAACSFSFNGNKNDFLFKCKFWDEMTIEGVRTYPL